VDPSETAEAFLERINAGRITVAVVGLGYVGLPLALQCAGRVEKVVGIDTDAGRVAAIGAGRSYIDDVSNGELGAAVESGKLIATTDYAIVRDCDAVLICVPTPLRKTREPDVSFIVRSVDAIAQHIGPGKVVILESTSYPGTTDELVRGRLERNGLRVGTDVWLGFSPERVDPGPGHSQFSIENVPKVVGGITPDCTRMAAALYRRVVDTVVEVSSSRVAEMVKLLENTYRSVNIAMVNELAVMCHKLGIDVWEVVDAAGTKPYGFEAFYPGPGLGGHCIPVDPFYLAWKARLHGFEPRFIDLAGRVNAGMPEYVVELAADLLNDAGKPLKGSAIHVLGVAYKRDVSDVRESPALNIIEMLRSKGALVSYSDSHVPAVALPDGARLEAVPIQQSELAAKDCVIIITDHSDFPWDAVVREARLILDTRNALKDYREPHIHKI